MDGSEKSQSITASARNDAPVACTYARIVSLVCIPSAYRSTGTKRFLPRCT